MDTILGRGFQYSLYVRDANGEWVQDGPPVFNLIPQAGIDYTAGLMFGTGASPISSWYMGLIEANFVPDASFTSATLPTIECQSYAEATRPAFSHVYDGVSVVSNAGSLATFTMNADKRVYGAFIVSSSTKGGNSGLTLSIARFTTPRDLVAGTEFGVGGVLTYIPTSL